MTVLLSFHDWGQYKGIEPVFILKNWKEVLGDSYFHEMFGRTFRIAFCVTLLAALFGAPEAYILNRMKSPWRGLFLLVILGGIVATSFAGPNLAAVGISPDDQLLVRPVGLVRLWALSKGHECPVTAISDVGVADRKTLARKWKTVGTHLPGVMTAGRFRSHHETDLWMVGRSKEVLVIELHEVLSDQTFELGDDPGLRWLPLQLDHKATRLIHADATAQELAAILEEEPHLGFAPY